MKRSFPALIVLVLIISCSRNASQPKKVSLADSLESLTYGREDFEQMTAAFRTDTVFMKMLDQRITAEDLHAILYKKLLHTDYDRRFENTHLTEADIKLAIYSFRTMKKVRQQFNAIDSALSAYRNADVLDSILKENQERDSIINSLGNPEHKEH